MDHYFICPECGKKTLKKKHRSKHCSQACYLKSIGALPPGTLKNMTEEARNLYSRYHMYRRGAEKRKKPFDITLNEFNYYISQPCYYCGTTDSIGMDRIDSKKGYNKDNVVSCCTSCNYLKMSFDYDSFLKHIKRIYHHLNLADLSS